MAIEILTVTLGVDDNNGSVKGTDLISGDKDDNQIVTVLDGGNLSGTYTFETWGRGTPTETGAGPGGDDTFYFDLSGFDDDFTIVVKSLDDLDKFVFTNHDGVATVGSVTTYTYTGSDGQTHTVSIDATSTNGTGTVNVVCFARGTEIRTDEGDVPIENLSEGDHILCSDGDTRPILWIGSRKVDAATLDLHPELRPIRIAPGAIGPGCPSAELRVSPQHRILLRDWRAELLFGESEVLTPAMSLINDTNIRRENKCDQVEYFHILLDAHHAIYANGLECETLMLDEVSKTALSTGSRAEICMLLPELVGDLGSFGSLCYRSLKSHEAKVLLGQN